MFLSVSLRLLTIHTVRKVVPAFAIILVRLLVFRNFQKIKLLLTCKLLSESSKFYSYHTVLIKVWWLRSNKSISVIKLAMLIV